MTTKFKLDENFGRRAQQIFQDRGLDVETVRDEKLHGAKDPRVLEAATTEDRILVTMDQDFANTLLFSPEKTAGIAVIRASGRLTRALLLILISSLLDALQDKLIRGKLWIVEPGRIREHQASRSVEDNDSEH